MKSRTVFSAAASAAVVCGRQKSIDKILYVMAATLVILASCAKEDAQPKAITEISASSGSETHYIGDAVANTSIESKAGYVDLFGWSTDAKYNNWGIHTKTSSTNYTTGNFRDWGKNETLISSLGSGWFTLSQSEWTYLINSRASNRYAKAKVNSVNGLLIFPDGYTGTTSGTGIAKVNSSSASYPSSSIPNATWSSMESAGCVFLPAAGYRNYTIGYAGSLY